MKRNYHMTLNRVYTKEPRDWWKCKDCGEEGTCDDLRASDCTFITPPCGYCGGCEESNECKRDCPGVLALLAGLGVNEQRGN